MSCERIWLGFGFVGRGGRLEVYVRFSFRVFFCEFGYRTAMGRVWVVSFWFRFRFSAFFLRFLFVRRYIGIYFFFRKIVSFSLGFILGFIIYFGRRWRVSYGFGRRKMVVVSRKLDTILKGRGGRESGR